MKALAIYAVALYYEMPRRVRTLIPWTIALLAFVSCMASVGCRPPAGVRQQGVQGPPATDTAATGILVPFEPLYVYSRWWANMERCSGYTGDMGRIRWYVANKPFLRTPQVPGLFLGIYYREGSDGKARILLSITEVVDSIVVHHEMLHALRDQNGQADAGGSRHGHEDFVDRCGALVGPLPPGSH